LACSQIHFPEPPPIANVSAGDHEGAAAVVMEGGGVFAQRGDVGLHDFEDQQAVEANEARVDQPALEVGVALGNERGGDLLGCQSRWDASR
jgi:hypothetical protein